MAYRANPHGESPLDRASRLDHRPIARERIEAEAGRKLSDRQLERVIDELITTNEEGRERA